MTETIETTLEKRSHRRRTRVLAASLAASLALAACSAKAIEATPTSTAASQSATTYTTSASTRTAGQPPTTESRPEGVLGCQPYYDLARYHNHEYEVCTAYVVNNAEIALQGFYKYGNDRISILADAARHHFETRYWEQPRRTIEQEVDSWPHTATLSGNDVDEHITVISVSSSLPADRGLVQTQESWRVTSEDGTILLNQPEHTENVTLCRGKLPGHLLHEWMVVSLSRQPGYNCIGFDERHNIEP